MARRDADLSFLPRLPARSPDSHKGDFGRVLLVGGSLGMAGAISLSGMAALRSGAGLVRVATSSACLPTVAGFEPSLMTLALPADSQGRIAGASWLTLADATAEATAVGCGPGIGRSQDLVELVTLLYARVEAPMVVDADALYALAMQPSTLTSAGGPRILTPHPGEFARLIGVPKFDPRDREKLARELATRSGAVVVLKGHHTVITDGRQLALNNTGNPGMATGGTGDVLTGIITALLAQRLAPYDAAQLGVYVHGLAGDLAADELGQTSLIASDLLRHLPAAWRRVAQ